MATTGEDAAHLPAAAEETGSGKAPPAPAPAPAPAAPAPPPPELTFVFNGTDVIVFVIQLACLALSAVLVWQTIRREEYFAACICGVPLLIMFFMLLPFTIHWQFIVKPKPFIQRALGYGDVEAGKQGEGEGEGEDEEGDE